MKRPFKAIQIFIDYEKLENRLPSRKEFELAWFGRELRCNESNYYYKVKRDFLAEREDE
jgi:hypothetical protein